MARWNRIPLLLLPPLLAGCVDYGVVKQHARDSFVQYDREGGLDILWVLDNSATMTEEQEQLALHVEAFAAVIALLGRDFHIGVTTTDDDVEVPGQLVGEMFDDDTPGLTEGLVEQITSVDRGSRTEQGFATAIAAAEPAGVNGTFGRVSAALEVVVYADEDDQSSLSVDDFLNQLAFPRPQAEVTVSTVVGDLPDGCFSAYAAADPGVRYIEATDGSGGQRESICASDMDGVMRRIALWALKLEDTFFLSKVPSPSTLVVEVDGALIHEREENGWTYNAGDNSIVFDGYAVPPPGSSIMVSYDEWLGNLEDTSEPAEE